jgi:hypothetical protein
MGSVAVNVEHARAGGGRSLGHESEFKVSGQTKPLRSE